MEDLQISVYQNNPTTDWVVHIKDKNLFIDFPSQEDAETFLIKLLTTKGE